MAVQLVAKNEDLLKENVRIDTFIGDDDCSTIGQLGRELDYHIKKWSDINHASKLLTDDMHKAKISQPIIDYMSYNFGVALKTNRGNKEAVEAALLAMTPHAFDDHSKCGSWCGYISDPENYKHKHLPRNEGLQGKNNKVLFPVFRGDFLKI